MGAFLRIAFATYFKLVFDSLASWEHLADMIGMTRSANAYAEVPNVSTLNPPSYAQGSLNIVICFEHTAVPGGFKSSPGTRLRVLS
jgi:hypothetical protein